MKLIQYFLILFLFVLGLNAQTNFDSQKLDSVLSKALEDFELPGMAVGVIKDSTIVFNKGYGYRVWNSDKMVDTESLFGIASLSKAFTAAAIGILVDEGKLDWNDRVIDYLPWFKLSDSYVEKELTIVDLLTHRAGYNTFDGDLLWYGSNYDRKKILRRFREMPAKISFRSEYGYSNIMFLAAGEVIEAVSGKTWDDFVKERILSPLDMKNTFTTNTNFNETTNVAYPHLERKVLQFLNYDNIGPAASINSCTSDMLKWAQMWLNMGTVNGNQILKEQTINKILTSYQAINVGNVNRINGRHFLNTGMGWFLQDWQGRKIVQHSGGLPGYISRLALVPEENLAVVVLTNDEAYLTTPVINYIIDLAIGELGDEDYFDRTLKYFKGKSERLEKVKEERKSKRIENTSPSQKLENFIGVYEDKMYGEAEIVFNNGSLNLIMLPSKELFSAKLNHWHYDTFDFKFNDPFLPEGLVTFGTNKDGKISGFKVDLPNPDFHFYNLNFIKKEN